MIGNRTNDDAMAAAAALELLQIKHQQPSRTECYAASEILHVILRSTDDSSHRRPLVPRRLLPSEDEATTQTNDSLKSLNATPKAVSELPIPVADRCDGQYISPLQCYIRKHCVEYFAASGNAITTKGRQTPVSEGRVGVRCAFCKDLRRDQKAVQATSYPNQITSIYSSVVMLQCRHFPNCTAMPDSVRCQLAILKKNGNSAANSSGTKRQDYWLDSARSMGFVDTDGGVRFVPRDVVEASSYDDESKILEEEDAILPSTNEIEEQEMKVAPEPTTTTLELPRLNVVSPFEFEPIVSSSAYINYELLVKGSTLVSLEDRDLVPDHVFLALAQLAPCQVTRDDQIGVYRSRPIGLQGMCCKHCQGYQPGPGYGKYFPNSVRSLAQSTTSATIVKHMTSKCNHVPRHIKDAISFLLKEANEDSKPAYATKKSNANDGDGRPKYGSRKVLFQRIWDRLQHGQVGTKSAVSMSVHNSPTSITVSSQGMPLPRVVQPTPIRRAVPFSPISAPFHSDAQHEIASDEESFIGVGAQYLYDDKNRRVTISLGQSNPKRKGAFASLNVFAPKKKSKA